ncbi:MAG: hypothetical protein ACYCYI_01690 [Saccharofermentanales bacterium]
MDYYHGTSIGGLTELKPFASQRNNLKESNVYLTTSRQLAAHYIWDYERCPDKSPMLDIRKDGVLVFQKMYSGALEYLYKGLSGYIYHCIGEHDQVNDAGVLTCAISKKLVPITDFEFVEDVYERIMSYEKQGTFIYERYEDLPRWRHYIIRGYVIRGIKEGNWLCDTSSPEYKFHQAKWPQYLREAEVLHEHGLL